MTTAQLVAQVAANADPGMARALHLISLWRGRMDALEAAIAAQDVRRRLQILLEVADLLEELQAISLRKAAA